MSIFTKISILVKTVDFINIKKKISILATLFGNLDFGQNFRKIPILVKIFEKS